MTLHQPANFDNPEVLEVLRLALAETSRTCPLVLLAYPKAADRLRDTRFPPGVRIIPPAEHLDFMTPRRKRG